MPRNWKKNKDIEIKIARERIRLLYQKAISIHSNERDLANRYIQIALKIAQRMRIKFPIEYKRNICRKCKKLLLDQSIVRIRQKREPHVVITCKNCGYKTRYNLNKKKSISNNHNDTTTEHINIMNKILNKD